MSEENNPLYFSLAKSTLGHTALAYAVEGVCLVVLGEEEGSVRERLRRLIAVGYEYALEVDVGDWHQALLEWIESPRSRLDLPLNLTGTAFQKRVWRVLQTIPPGETRSYSDIAQSLDNPKASRAVAGACAANRWALVIPCHRVICRDGSLSGFRWGDTWKQGLLEREAG
ncbi:MAG: methylated-DNA--[protein]-cysteine S-methyltransferase [Methylococcaceae bacterium]